MVFRFWTPSSGNVESKLVEHTPEHDPGMLALIEDVVASKRGVLLTTHDQIFVSGLKHPADALVVSRHVQLGLQGFRGRHGANPVSVSIAIDASNLAHPGTPAEAEAGHHDGPPSSTGLIPEPPHDLVTLLKLSKPAQILVTHDLYKQLTAIKGLPVKTFPGRFGVYEYLWAAQDKLDVLQSEPQLTLAAVPPALPVSSGPKEATAPPTPIIPARPANDIFATEPLTLGIVQQWLAALRSPRNLVFASLALIAIVAVAIIAIRMIHGSSSQSASPIVSGSASGATSAGKPTANTTTPPAPLGSPSTRAKNWLKSLTPGKTGVTKESRKPSQVATPPAPSSQCSLSGDFSRYVSLAEQDRGRGDYADAARIFRQVLDCDPSNAAAREGLNRAIQGQEQSQRQR